MTGGNHVAVTVTDLQRSRSWYERVLDWSSVFEGNTKVCGSCWAYCSEG